MYLQAYQVGGIPEFKKYIYQLFYEGCHSRNWIVQSSALLGLGVYLDVLKADCLEFSRDLFEVSVFSNWQMLYFLSRAFKENTGCHDGSDKLVPLLLIIWGKMLKISIEASERLLEDFKTVERIKIWVSALPQFFDTEHSSEQHELLYFLMTTYPSLVYGEDNCKLDGALLKMIAIIGNPCTTKELSAKFTSLIAKLKKSESDALMFKRFESGLSEEQVIKLNFILASE